jgi:hypothetical protein
MMTQSKKPKASFTIDFDILEAFNKLAEDRSLNKSKWIEKQMQEYLKENGVEVNKN